MGRLLVELSHRVLSAKARVAQFGDKSTCASASERSRGGNTPKPPKIWAVQRSMRVTNDAAKAQAGWQVTSLDRPDLSISSGWFVRAFPRSLGWPRHHRETSLYSASEPIRAVWNRFSRPEGCRAVSDRQPEPNSDFCYNIRSLLFPCCERGQATIHLGKSVY